MRYKHIVLLRFVQTFVSERIRALLPVEPEERERRDWIGRKRQVTEAKKRVHIAADALVHGERSSERIEEEEVEEDEQQLQQLQENQETGENTKPATRGRSRSSTIANNLEKWWLQVAGGTEAVLDQSGLGHLLDRLGFQSLAQRRTAATQLDENGDGAISFQEVEEWLSNQDLAKRAQWMTLEEVWHQIDKDGSGTLDRRETRALLIQLGYATYPDRRQAIKELDANGDGQIEWEEFCSWFAQQQANRKSVHLAQGVGTDYKCGGKTWHLSAKGETEVVVKRLEEACEADDALLMTSALDSARHLSELLGNHGELPQAAKVLAEQIEQVLAEDEEKRTTDRLFRSVAIEHCLQRFWDLIVVATRDEARANRALGFALDMNTDIPITLGAYTQMHVRIAVCVAEARSKGSAISRDSKGKFSYDRAVAEATADWKADISEFSESSHVTSHIDHMRVIFRNQVASRCQMHGYLALFEKYDHDGSGDLDFKEFEKAVRKDLGLSEDAITAAHLQKLFEGLDTDHSGHINGPEFVAWLIDGSTEIIANHMREHHNSSPHMLKLFSQRLQKLKEEFLGVAAELSEELGWKHIFDAHDDDGSGELDGEEFQAAIRKECNVPPEKMSEAEIAEIFLVVDADNSGGICADELIKFLHEGADETTMEKGPFFRSLFQLAQLWVGDRLADGPTEHSITDIRRLYVVFFNGLFQKVTNPTDRGAAKLAKGIATEDIPVWDKQADGRSTNARMQDSEGCASEADIPNFRLAPLKEVLIRAGFEPREVEEAMREHHHSSRHGHHAGLNGEGAGGAPAQRLATETAELRRQAAAKTKADADSAIDAEARSGSSSMAGLRGPSHHTLRTQSSTAPAAKKTQSFDVLLTHEQRRQRAAAAAAAAATSPSGHTKQQQQGCGGGFYYNMSPGARLACERRTTWAGYNLAYDRRLHLPRGYHQTGRRGLDRRVAEQLSDTQYRLPGAFERLQAPPAATGTICSRARQGGGGRLSPARSLVPDDDTDDDAEDKGYGSYEDGIGQIQPRPRQQPELQSSRQQLNGNNSSRSKGDWYSPVAQQRPWTARGTERQTTTRRPSPPAYHHQRRRPWTTTAAVKAELSEYELGDYEPSPPRGGLRHPNRLAGGGSIHRQPAGSMALGGGAYYSSSSRQSVRPLTASAAAERAASRERLCAQPPRRAQRARLLRAQQLNQRQLKMQEAPRPVTAPEYRRRGYGHVRP